MKVGIFIVGAPKAGTTSLHQYMNEHSDILMSAEKEPDFFSDKELLEQGLYYGTSRIDTIEEYHSLFSEKKEESYFGEASVSYLFYPEVSKRIKKYNINSKIIIMLRNPVDRAFSHYLMDYRLGLISENFEKVFEKKQGLNFQQYFELGQYYNQVKNYFDVFGKENVHIIWYSDFKVNTKNQVLSTFNFLGINSDENIDFKKVHNSFSLPKNNLIRRIYSVVWLREILSFFFPDKVIKFIKSLLFRKGKKPKMNIESRNKILRYYLDDISNLENLLSVNLDRWKK